MTYERGREREFYIFERALFGREINAGPNLKRER